MKRMNKEEIAEDFCFICKDGGPMRICDFKNCLKCYHSGCVNEQDSFLKSKEPWICGWHKCFLCEKAPKFQCFTCPIAFCGHCVTSEEFVQVKGTKGLSHYCLRLAVLKETKLNEDIDETGNKVDFTDEDSYDSYFLDYYQMMKEKEGLSPEMILKARSLFKEGKIFHSEADIAEVADHSEEMQAVSDYDASGDEVVPLRQEKKRKSRSNKAKRNKKIPRANDQGETRELRDNSENGAAPVETEAERSSLPVEEPAPSTANEGNEPSYIQGGEEDAGSLPFSYSDFLEYYRSIL